MNRFLLALVLLSLLLTACHTDPDPEISADEQVRRALNALKAAPFYNVRGVAKSNLFDKDTGYEIYYQAPDRYHVVMYNGAEVIVIGERSWGLDKTVGGWISLAKPNPDPRSLLTPFEPGEITGFAYVKFDPIRGGCELFRANYGTMRFDVCIDSKTIRLSYLEFSDETGSINHTYGFSPRAVFEPHP